jgi:anti-sigma regulatory factor (Ser/Thr protein kinase)
MILNVSLDLPGDSIYLRVARHLSRTLMEDLGVVEPDIADMEFVLGELCSNVIRHAQSTDGRFTITMQYFADKAIVTVEDKGVGFPFKNVHEVGTLRPDFHGKERIGGFGLNLVRQLADRLEFLRSDAQGTTVQAEKELHYKTTANAREAAALDQNNSSSMSVSSETSR